MKIIIAALMCLSFFTAAQAEVSNENIINTLETVITPVDITTTPGVINIPSPAISNPKYFVAENDIRDRTKEVLGLIDLSSLISSLRASVLINSKAEIFYGAHVPIATFIGNSGTEYINLNAGFVYSSDKNASDFLFSLGFRVDSFVSKFGAKNSNIVTAELPPIELGPFISYGFNNWMYGGMLSIRLG